ncbi:MAG TPA: PH domain-containing protein [Candidatus Limnocylindrales bacterium]|nr:PH domain-containing protein [Candidatus Limnocylindrales bacterium]
MNEGASHTRGYLLPGERVLWEGRPDVWGFSMRGAWYAIPFSLLWGGFAIFWEIGVLTSNAPFFFSIWGIPFVLLGLYMIFGRIWVARREARNTRYAITDRRVLIRSGAFRPTLVSLELDTLPGTELSERGDGSGSITFGTYSGFFRLPPGWPAMGTYRNPPGFFAVPDVRRVFDTLQRARSDLRAASAPAAPSTV